MLKYQGSGHKASIVKTDGGSAFNVATSLSLLGAEVLFFELFGVCDSDRWSFRSSPLCLIVHTVFSLQRF